MYGYSDVEYRRFHAYAWRYLILFSLLYCFLNCTRLNLSSAGAVMMEGLGCSKSDLGILAGVLFWTYAVGQIINGRLGEIIGPGKLVVASAVLSVAANVLFAFQSSFAVMVVLWGLNGYFQSMAWTPGMAILAKWWPGSSHGFATGVANAFSGFGRGFAILSVALAFGVLPALGWRAAFLAPAAFPLAALVAYLIWSRSSPTRIGLCEYVEEDPERVRMEDEMRAIVSRHGKLYPYRYVLSDRQFKAWTFIAFVTGLGCYGLLTWAPLYFVDRFGISVTNGLMGALSLPVGMGVGTFVVPWLTDRWCPANRLPAVIACSLAGAASVGGFLLLDPTIGWQMACVQVLLFAAGFCIHAINGMVWAYATDIGGRVFSGTASGVLNFAAYLGAAVQSFVYGFLLDRIGWSAVFASIAILCGLMAVMGCLGRKPFGN